MGDFLDFIRSDESIANRAAFKALRGSSLFKRGLERIKNKGYYREGRRGRGLGEWVTSNEDANEMLSRSLDDLRNDSNDLYANNAISTGAINTFVTNVVGTGLKLYPAIDYEYLGISEDEADKLQTKITREWELYSKTCDITQQSSFTELQQLVLRSTLVNGDVFVNVPFKKRSGVLYETCLNLIESQRISNPDHKQDSSKFIMGVELDGDGAPTKYHYSTSVGYGLAKKWNSLKIHNADGRKQVLHIFRKLRVNQMRGVPILAPIIELIKKLDTYSQAELDAAVINSFFTVFIKKRSNDNSPLDVVTNMGAETGASSSDKDLKLGSATVVELFEDEEGIELADPKRPNQSFEAFFRAIVSEIGVGIGIPYEVLMKQFNSSYSASRGAIIEAVKVFDELEDFLITDFCQPVYEAFLFEAVSKGRIEAEGFLTDPLRMMAFSQTEWIGPIQGELDPMKAAKAAEKRIETGISNEIIETQATGRKYENVLSGAKRVARLRGTDGESKAED